jgi:cytochrome c2
LLVAAAIEGKFLTHNVVAAKSSFTNCVTCHKLGQRQVTRLSKVLYPPAEVAAEGDEEEQI